MRDPPPLWTLTLLAAMSAHFGIGAGDAEPLIPREKQTVGEHGQGLSALRSRPACNSRIGPVNAFGQVDL